MSESKPLSPTTQPIAIWSLILGILSITCLWILGSIPAIILGVKGMKKANADPDKVGGKGLALGGIITGIIGMITGTVSAVIIASATGSMALPAFQSFREEAQMKNEMMNVRHCLLGLHNYAVAHSGSFPDQMEDLTPHFIEETGLYAQSIDDEAPLRFVYRPGLKTSSAADEPVIYSPAKFSGDRQVVGFVDGQVRDLSPEEMDMIIEKFK